MTEPRSRDSFKPPGLHFLLAMALLATGAIISVGAPSIAADSPGLQSFYIAEGLLANGQAAKAFEYYQAAYADLLPEGRSESLKKTLERLMAMAASMKSDPLKTSYRRAYVRMWPELEKSLPPVDGGEVKSASTGISLPDPGATLRQKVPDDEESDLKLKILIYFGDYRPHETIRKLTISEKKRFQADQDEFSEEVMLRSKRDFAEKKGYPTERFGPDNFKMVSIQQVVYKIYDSKWGDVIATNEESSGKGHR